MTEPSSPRSTGPPSAGGGPPDPLAALRSDYLTLRCPTDLRSLALGSNAARPQAKASMLADEFPHGTSPQARDFPERSPLTSPLRATSPTDRRPPQTESRRDSLSVLSCIVAIAVLLVSVGRTVDRPPPHNSKSMVTADWGGDEVPHTENPRASPTARVSNSTAAKGNLSGRGALFAIRSPALLPPRAVTAGRRNLGSALASRAALPGPTAHADSSLLPSRHRVPAALRRSLTDTRLTSRPTVPLPAQAAIRTLLASAESPAVDRDVRLDRVSNQPESFRRRVAQSLSLRMRSFSSFASDSTTTGSP